jgi:hypothetical protein
MHDMTNPETDNPAAYWCAIAKPCTVDHRESLHCGPSDWSIQLLKLCHEDLKVSMSNMSRQITMIQRLLLSDIGTLYRSIEKRMVSYQFRISISRRKVTPYFSQFYSQ